MRQVALLPQSGVRTTAASRQAGRAVASTTHSRQLHSAVPPAARRVLGDSRTGAHLPWGDRSDRPRTPKRGFPAALHNRNNMTHLAVRFTHYKKWNGDRRERLAIAPGNAAPPRRNTRPLQRYRSPSSSSGVVLSIPASRKRRRCRDMAVAPAATRSTAKAPKMMT